MYISVFNEFKYLDKIPPGWVVKIAYLNCRSASLEEQRIRNTYLKVLDLSLGDTNEAAKLNDALLGAGFSLVPFFWDGTVTIMCDRLIYDKMESDDSSEFPLQKQAKSEQQQQEDDDRENRLLSQ